MSREAYNESIFHGNNLVSDALAAIVAACSASTILSGRRQLPWPVIVEKSVSFLSSFFFDNYLLLFQ